MQMTRLIPMLPARSIAASIAFYEKLGFTFAGLRARYSKPAV